MVGEVGAAGMPRLGAGCADSQGQAWPVGLAWTGEPGPGQDGSGTGGLSTVLRCMARLARRGDRGKAKAGPGGARSSAARSGWHALVTRVQFRQGTTWRGRHGLVRWWSGQDGHRLRRAAARLAWCCDGGARGVGPDCWGLASRRVKARCGPARLAWPAADGPGVCCGV